MQMFGIISTADLGERARMQIRHHKQDILFSLSLEEETCLRDRHRLPNRPEVLLQAFGSIRQMCKKRIDKLHRRYPVCLAQRTIEEKQEGDDCKGKDKN